MEEKTYNIIRERRLQLGLTLKTISEAIGVSIATANRYENSDIDVLNVGTIKKLAPLLQCSIPHLLGVTDEKQTTACMYVSNLEREIILAFRELPYGEQKMLLRSLDVDFAKYTSKFDNPIVENQKGEYEKMA